jgi:hypothetical protein
VCRAAIGFVIGIQLSEETLCCVVGNSLGFILLAWDILWKKSEVVRISSKNVKRLTMSVRLVYKCMYRYLQVFLVGVYVVLCTACCAASSYRVVGSGAPFVFSAVAWSSYAGVV